jgi:hypothetical protein
MPLSTPAHPLRRSTWPSLARTPSFAPLRILIAPLAALLAGLGWAAPAPAEEAGWTSLFNGKDLDGWVQRGGQAKYSVADECIVGETVPKTPNSFLCTTKAYGDFVLEYEFNCDNGLNSGVQVRSNAYDHDTQLQWAGKLTTIPKDRVHGLQAEIDADKPERRWTGGLYEEGRRGWLAPLEGKPEAQAAFKRGEWNRVRIEANGDRVATFINDIPCAELRDSLTVEGFIALQVHGISNKQGGPWRVRWRKLRIRELGRHAWTPLFNGKDLAGWTALPGGDWRVKEGVIVGTSAKSEARHGQLLLDQPLKDFTLRLKFRSVTGNSGVYFRAERVNSAVALHGLQAEVEPALATGGLYETGGRAWVAKPDPKALATHYKPGDWSVLTVSAHGKDVTVHVNHFKTAELRGDPGRTEGLIGLQLHGGQDMHVEYKDIELLSPMKP